MCVLVGGVLEVEFKLISAFNCGWVDEFYPKSLKIFVDTIFEGEMALKVILSLVCVASSSDRL